MCETVIRYGRFALPSPGIPGPKLGLDLSQHSGIRVDFSGVEDVMNINIVYRTTKPVDPSSPRYYARHGINIGPSASGSSVGFELDFPTTTTPEFNWESVDGVLVLINGASTVNHTSYTLDSLVFID